MNKLKSILMAFCVMVLCSINVEATTLATQVSTVPAGTWKQITTNVTMDSIDPEKVPAYNSNYPGASDYHATSGFKSLWNAWNSGAFMPQLGTCGSIAYTGAGHADYWGNEIVALDLCGAADGGPTWHVLTTPWVTPITWPRPTGAWPDGSPSMPHTYDGLVAGDGYLMLFTTQSDKIPAKVHQGYMINLAAGGSWVSLGLSDGTNQGTSAWDTTRHVAWFENSDNRKLTKFDPVTKIFTYIGLGISGSGVLDSIMGYDPTNDLLVNMSFRYAAKNIFEYTIATNTWKTAVQVNAPATRTGQHAMAWSPARSAWIVWMDTLNDGKVWEVKRTSVTAGVPTYTWTLLTDPSNTLIPMTTTHNGSYEKFQLITIGSYEYLIGTLTTTSGVWAFKIPL